MVPFFRQHVLAMAVAVHPAYDRCLPQLPIGIPLEFTFPSHALVAASLPDVFADRLARVTGLPSPDRWGTSFVARMGKYPSSSHPSTMPRAARISTGSPFKARNPLFLRSRLV